MSNIRNNYLWLRDSVVNNCLHYFVQINDDNYTVIIEKG